MRGPLVVVLCRGDAAAGASCGKGVAAYTGLRAGAEQEGGIKDPAGGTPAKTEGAAVGMAT